MSDLEDAIRDVLRTSLENAFRTEPDANPHNYHGGVQRWIATVTEMRMNEIRQWLHNPDYVTKHLEEIRGRK